MKIVFVSNFLNHHQLPFCLEMIKHSEFIFIASMPVWHEQLELGYSDMNEQFEFVLKTYENEENILRAKQLICEADIVVAGSCTFPFDWIKPRLDEDKLTFWFSERLFKHGILQMFYLPTYKRVLAQCTKFRKNKNYYLLCAGSYVASDYKKMRAFPNKMFKWGYFPKIAEKDIESLLAQKAENSEVELLWVARFIDWKHPELPIKLMRYLKEKHIKCHLTMLGKGILFERTKALAEKLDVLNDITFKGAVPFEQVREYMDKANIFLFTSNRLEGWGAVLNEAMNSACAIVCNKQIGSSKYLIKNGKSGLIYGKKKEFFKQVETLISNKTRTRYLGNNAYKAISSTWSSKNASENFLEVCNNLLSGEELVKKNDEAMQFVTKDKLNKKKDKSFFSADIN